jgi:hypothetical protein
VNNIYSKDIVKNISMGLEYGGEIFLSQSFIALFRRESKGFVNNIWLLSLTSDQYCGAARFRRLPDYAKKFKTAVKNAGHSVTYIGERNLSDEDYGALLNQVAETEAAMTQSHVSLEDDDETFDGEGL